MQRIKWLVLLCGMTFAHAAAAYEYPLQFPPPPGALGIGVAGYSFSGDTVVGNCSYHTTHSGSGRGGGYKSITTYYYQTCTWDLFGNLLSTVAGAPTAPAPLAVRGTKTIYAVNAADGRTGTDTKLSLGGFVGTIGPHYTWHTSNAYLGLAQALYVFPLRLRSDGDTPLTITAVTPSSLIAKVSLRRTTCVGTIAPGKGCMIVVGYDPNALTSPTGLAYDTLTITVTSTAGQATDFVQRFTISVRIGDSGS